MSASFPQLFPIALLLLTACGTVSSQPRGFVSPLDGQTQVATFQDLWVRTGGIGFPEDTAIPQDTVLVYDLADGNPVPGRVWRDGDDLRFSPTDGWKADANFAWTVRTPRIQGRSPQLSLPKTLRGTAFFSTESRFDVLDTSVDSAGELCLLLSAPLEEIRGAVHLEVEGVHQPDTQWAVVHERDQAKALPLPEGDPGVSLLCWDGALSPGANLLIALGEQLSLPYTAQPLEPSALPKLYRRSSW